MSTETSTPAPAKLAMADLSTMCAIPIAVIGEDGANYVAHGHVEPYEFMDRLRLLNQALGLDMDPEDLEDVQVVDDVQHCYAVRVTPDDVEEWLIRWNGITAETLGAFPITLLSFP